MNSEKLENPTEQSLVEKIYQGQQYISYHDESYLPTICHITGWAGHGQVHLTPLTPLGELLATMLPRSYPQYSAQVVNERERVHRAGPLELLRKMEQILKQRVEFGSLHFLAIIPFEIAHIFEDLSNDLPLLFEFQFVEMEHLTCRELPWSKSTGKFSCPELNVINDTGNQFKEIFKQTRENFAAGDIFEIVLSRRISLRSKDHSHDYGKSLFRYLGERIASLQAPYRFALDFPQTMVLGASPELLVRVCQGKVIARPISGSMRRTAYGETNRPLLDPNEEGQFAKLLESEKEKSELDMLIDLARHDLHRVCQDVRVSDYREALVLETVVHTQATVLGNLLPEMASMDALFSCLNAGTLVGAPKRKAMEIIALQEKSPRGYYGGNLIHIRPGGDLRATILIRTVVVSKDQPNALAKLQAGATVLLESNEDYEYWECGAKMQGLLQLLGLQDMAFGPGEPPNIVQSNVVPKDQIRRFYEKSYATNSTKLLSRTAAKARDLHFLLVDNEDSFTFNLEALFASFGVQITVLRNNASMPNLQNFSGLILSPGPASPAEAGNLLEYVRQAAQVLPVFGVCLGFQAMVEALGGSLGRLQHPLHGKVRQVKVTGQCPEFEGIPEIFPAARYHSLFAAKVPSSLSVVAVDEIGTPMALRGPNHWPPFFAVQFHPESFLTGEVGVEIVKNWLNLVLQWQNQTAALHNAQSAFHAIVNLEPSEEFLRQTEKGLPPKEMAQLVTLLRKHANIPKNLEKAAKEPLWPLIDVCGTGGTSAPRLNTSTLTALFLPNFGVAVSKHGGRSASGRSGSWDLLEALVLGLSHCFENAAEMLRSQSICYLSAALTYGQFARYANCRKSFGRPSLFNMLGPLLNPTPLGARLLGCWNYEVQDLLADTVLALNETALLVVSHDEEGFLDEAAPWSHTRLIWVSGGRKQLFEIAAQEKKPGLRSELFADGIAAAKAFLQLPLTESPTKLDTPHTEDVTLALRLVGWNVAIGVWVAAQISKPKETLGDVTRAQLPLVNTQQFLSTCQQIYGDFVRNFSLHLQAAQRRLAALCAISPLHVQSPIRQTSAEFLSEDRSENSDKINLTNGVARPKPFFDWQRNRNLLLAEIKLRTPTKTFENSLALAERINSYRFADGISVVTHHSFGGSLELLRKVRLLTSLPILAKDFVTNESQITSLINAGANAVLLLLDMLGEEKTRQLADVVSHKGAVPFVESSTEIPSFGIPMLNSRSLFSLQEGKHFRDCLARRLMLPPHFGKPFVLASSFEHPLEVCMAQPKGGAIVVGSALMKLNTAQDIESWICQAKTHGLLKVCGAQNKGEVAAALQAGANLIGINLIPTSARYFGKQPAEIRQQLLQSTEMLPHLVFLTSHQTPDELLNEVQKYYPWWEQPYNNARLYVSRGMLRPSFGISSPQDRLSILEPAEPGSGKCVPYANQTLKRGIEGHQSTPSAVLCASGVTSQNAHMRLREALDKGYAVAGIDAASGVEFKNNETGQRLGFNTSAIAAIRSQLDEFFGEAKG